MIFNENDVYMYLLSSNRITQILIKIGKGLQKCDVKFTYTLNYNHHNRTVQF